MTPRELHEKLQRMHPRADYAKPDWVDQYELALNRYSGDRLDDAWDDWHQNNKYAPSPSELAKLCRPAGAAEKHSYSDDKFANIKEYP